MNPSLVQASQQRKGDQPTEGPAAPQDRRRDSIWTLILFMLFFFLYSFSALPSVHVGDCGELAASIHTQSIAHPPGFPFFCLFYRALELCLAFLGSPVFRMNITSSLAVAGSAALLFRFLRALGIRFAGALAGTLLYGTCASVWEQAQASEVYGLHLLMLSLSLAGALNAARRPGVRSMCLLGLIIGLGLAVHPYLFLTNVPALILLALSGEHRRRNLRGSAVTAFLGFLSTGLLCYIYLPLRTVHEPPLMWGSMDTLGKVIGHVLRNRYDGFLGNPYTLDRTLGQVSSYLGAGLEQLPGGIALAGMLFLAAAPAFLIFRVLKSGQRDSNPGGGLPSLPVLLSLLMGFLAAVAAPMVLVNYEADLKNIYIHTPFYAQSYIYICTSLALLLNLLPLRLPQTPGSPNLVFAVLAVVLAIFLSVSFSQRNLSAQDGAYQYAMNHLRSAPPDSTIFAGGDLFYMPWLYLRLVEGRSDRVSAFQVNGFAFIDDPGLLGRLVISAMGRGGALFTSTEEIPAVTGARVASWGMLHRLLPVSQEKLRPPDWSWLNTSILSRPCDDYLLQGQVRDIHTKRGIMLWEKGSQQEALREFEAGAAATAGFNRVDYNLGCLYLERDQYPRAAELFQRAMEKEPLFEDGALNLSLALSRMGESEKALRVLRDYLRRVQASQGRGESLGERLPGVSGKVYNNLGAIYLEAGANELAASHFAIAGLPQSDANLIRTLLIMDRVREAVAEARKRIQGPGAQFPNLLYWGAMAVMRLGKPGEQLEALARSWATKAQELAPGDADINVLSGDMALARGERKQARGFYESALALGSRDERMLFNMAFLITGEEPSRALEFYRGLSTGARDPELRSRSARMVESLSGSEALRGSGVLEAAGE